MKHCTKCASYEASIVQGKFFCNRMKKLYKHENSTVRAILCTQYTPAEGATV